jgi:hypothetical protein
MFATVWLAAFAFIRNVLVRYSSALHHRKTASAKHAIAAILILGLSCALPASEGNLSVVNGDYEYHYYGQVVPMQVLHADMASNFSNPDVMWGYSIHGETFSFFVEAWDMRKDANGDWWADWVSINGVEKEYQNLGPDPFLWGLQTVYAANGASSPGAWISCDFGYPPSTYRASAVAFSVNGIASTSGVSHIYARGGASLTFNMSASAPNNNCSHIWLEATANQNESNWLYLESNNSWQTIYSTSGTSGSFSYTLDPDVRHYYFLCRSMGDTKSAPAIIHVEVTTTTGTTPNTIQGWDVTLYEGQEIWPGVDYGSFVESTRGIGYDDYDNVHPLQYMISGHTDWRTVTGYGSYESETWMPPHAGDYQIYYIQIGNDEWADSNMTGPHTLHVLPARVTAQDLTVPVGTLTLDTFTSVASVTIAPGLTFSPHVVIQGYGEDPNLNTIPAGTYQFQIKYYNNDTWTDPYETYCGVPSEIISPTYTLVVAPPAPPGPIQSLNIMASALNGQISASGGDGMAVHLGETISVTSIATALGWLSEHNIKGYTSGTSPFSIPEGATTLPALPDTTTSGRTVTWTPTNSGSHTLYVEAFTGTSSGHQLHGVSGWPGYAGGTFGGYEDKRISVHIRNNPTGSVQILDANLSPISMENGIVTTTRGSTYYVRVSGSDADGDVERYYARIAKPDGTLAVHVDTPQDSGNGSNGSKTFGPYTADTSGDWLYWGHVTDVAARAWDSVTPWNENGNGWYSSDKYTLRVPNVNGAAYVSQSVPTTLSCGEHAVVSVTMQNNDSTTWDNNAPLPYSLGSQNPQDNYTWGFNRVSVGATPVQPGGTKTFTFTITAPDVAGDYDFQWRMVQDGKEWFGDSTPNVVIQVIDLTALGEDGIPIGLTLDSNNNGVPDLVEQRLGLNPSGTSNSLPANTTKEYEYDANNQMTIAPERTYTLDPEGNITGD